jgi:hypothetical protein
MGWMDTYHTSLLLFRMMRNKRNIHMVFFTDFIPGREVELVAPNFLSGGSRLVQVCNKVF